MTSEPDAARARRGEVFPPHITVLYPFAPADVIGDTTSSELATLFSRFPAFDFHFTAIERRSGLTFLVAEPMEPFSALTAAVYRHWPEYPPYAGQFLSTFPVHLTVSSGTRSDVAVSQVQAMLPMEARVSEVWLMVESRNGQWRIHDVFPLANPGH